MGKRNLRKSYLMRARRHLAETVLWTVVGSHNTDELESREAEYGRL